MSNAHRARAGVKRPETFSKHFGLKKTQAELDFVDIYSDRDTEVFLDPHAFASGTDHFSIKCRKKLASFFAAVLDAIRKDDEPRGLTYLEGLKEAEKNCLGYCGPNGHGYGITKEDCNEIYRSLVAFRAAHRKETLLKQLLNCVLVVDGIGPDKMSDMTTDILRREFIEFTQAQCDGHKIPLEEEVLSGLLWDGRKKGWSKGVYTRLPVIDEKGIILVPKAFVNPLKRFSYNKRDYYDHYVLDFIRDQHLNKNSSLVRTLKNGERRVYKKDLEKDNPLSADYLRRFSMKNPAVFKKYKRQMPRHRPITDAEIEKIMSAG